MKTQFEKRIWMEAKSKLLKLYGCLAENDFKYEIGKEHRMLERIRTKINVPKREFYQFVGLCESEARTLSA